MIPQVVLKCNCYGKLSLLMEWFFFACLYVCKYGIVICDQEMNSFLPDFCITTMNCKDLLQHYTKQGPIPLMIPCEGAIRSNWLIHLIHTSHWRIIAPSHSRPWNIYIIFCLFRPSSDIRKRLDVLTIGSYCHCTIVILDYHFCTTILLLITLMIPLWLFLEFAFSR